MSQNFTQPEEIEYALVEMIKRDNEDGVADYLLDFIGIASEDKKPDFDRVRNQPGEHS